MTRRFFASLGVLSLFALGCSKDPPPSQLPNAQAAIDRMRATTSCAQAIQANDYFVIQGIVLLLSVSIAVAMFVLDMIYPLIDPRIAEARS